MKLTGRRSAEYETAIGYDSQREFVRQHVSNAASTGGRTYGQRCPGERKSVSFSSVSTYLFSTFGVTAHEPAAPQTLDDYFIVPVIIV